MPGYNPSTSQMKNSENSGNQNNSDFFGNFFKKKVALTADDARNMSMQSKTDPSYLKNSNKNGRKHSDFKDKLEKIVKNDQKLSNMILLKDVLKEKRYSTANGKIEKKTIVSPSNKYVITKKTNSRNDDFLDNYYDSLKSKNNKKNQSIDIIKSGNDKRNYSMANEPKNLNNSHLSNKVESKEVIKRPSSAPKMNEPNMNNSKNNIRNNLAGKKPNNDFFDSKSMNHTNNSNKNNIYDKKLK